MSALATQPVDDARIPRGKPSGPRPATAQDVEAGINLTETASIRTKKCAWAGTLSTDGGLVFVGDMEGYLTALDAETGKSLWQFQTGAPITTAPMT